MALIKCKECFHQISKSATQCPNCGAKIKHTTLIAKIGAGFLALFVLNTIFNSGETAPTKVATITEEQKPIALNQNGDIKTESTSSELASESQEKLEGEYFYVPSDSNAKFYTLDKAKKDGMSVIITKRIGSSGVSYSSRLYDCHDNTFRYLGTGETREAMEKSHPDENMSPIIKGAIAYYVGLEACK